ncbi:hypothetical protein Q5P01_025727 [Channa striata]|uniref:Uncharacterized protein n=1 Tax=Channa striata TaxID=64152 RepID=A0AA88INS8_CHASR|nr:hypothetical protein Q5P01_025727 [Channa striata]
MKIPELFLLAVLGCSLAEGTTVLKCDLMEQLGNFLKNPGLVTGINSGLDLPGHSLREEWGNVSECALDKIKKLGEKVVINNIAKYICKTALKPRFKSDPVHKPIVEPIGHLNSLKQRLTQLIGSAHSPKLQRVQPARKPQAKVESEAHLAARKRGPTKKTKPPIIVKPRRGPRSTKDVDAAFCSDGTNATSNVCGTSCESKRRLH